MIKYQAMALSASIKDIAFGVGDRVKVTQKIQEEGKSRLAAFDGMVISIKGSGAGRTFTVRRIGEAQVGIEKIFPVSLPTIEKVEVLKKGTAGVKKAKLYYVRNKSKREIDKIYSRASRRQVKH